MSIRAQWLRTLQMGAEDSIFWRRARLCLRAHSLTQGFALSLERVPTVAQALRPYPQYLLVETDAVLLPEGKAHYDSMQIKLTKRMSYGLNGLAFFTWSKNLTNDAGSPGSTTYASAFGSILQYPGQNPVTIDP